MKTFDMRSNPVNPSPCRTSAKRERNRSKGLFWSTWGYGAYYGPNSVIATSPRLEWLLPAGLQISKYDSREKGRVHACGPRFVRGCTEWAAAPASLGSATL